MRRKRNHLGFVLAVSFVLAAAHWLGGAVLEELEGELRPAVVDYLDGTSVEKYFIETAGRRVREVSLAGISGAAALVPGTRVRVQGIERGGILEVERVEPLARGPVKGFAPVVGERRVAVLLVNFQDDTRQPYSAASARQMMFTTVSNWYRDASYGAFWLAGDVFGWFTMAIDKTCNIGSIANAGVAAAAGAGVDLGAYGNVYFVFPRQGCGWAGMAFVGGSYAFTDQYLDKRVTVHELGHNFGLPHANGLRCGSNVIALPFATACASQEYLDFYDAMGNGFGGVYHFSPAYKAMLGWIPAGESIAVADDGIYELEPFELPGSAAKALAVDSFFDGKHVRYFLEYRRKIGEDAGISNSRALNGVIVRLLSVSYNGEAVGPSGLLDFMPQTSSYEDAPLAVGETFTEPGGVTFAPLEHDGSRMLVSIGFDPQFAGGMVEFTPSWYGAQEGNPSIAVSIVRKVRSRGAVSVDVATVSDTAAEGEDFTGVAETVTFGDGDRGPKTVTIPILNDTAAEGYESFAVVLSNPTAGLSLGAATRAVVYIDDDEEQPYEGPYFEPAEYSVSESDAEVTLWVTGKAGSNATGGVVRYSTRDKSAVAGSDYVAVQGTLVPDPQQERWPIAIQLLDDSLEEATETFTVVLEQQPGGVGSDRGTTAVVTIRDDDPPVGHPPVAHDLSVVTDDGVTVACTLVGSDIDGDPLEFIIVSQPGHGTLRGTPPALSYAPDADFTGVDTFLFKVSDGRSASNDATVAISVCGRGESLGGTVFRWLCDLDRASGIAAEGTVVAGLVLGPNERTEAARWTGAERANRLAASGDFASAATGVSADGTTIVGWTGSAGGTQAFRWTAAGGLELVSYLDGESCAAAASADGSAFVGSRGVAGREEAFRWTAAAGMEALGDLGGGDEASAATAVSADGAIVVGSSSSSAGREAFRWTPADGMRGLGDLVGGEFASVAHGISADGSIAIGVSAGASGWELVRWDAGNAIESLGVLAEAGTALEDLTCAISADGSTIVGSRIVVDRREAFYVSAAGGMRSLAEMLESDYGVDGAGWDLEEAVAIAGDGRTIAGNGTGPDGRRQAWLVRLGECLDAPETARIDGVPAGPIEEGSTVRLDGSGSAAGGDSEGASLRCRWEIASGPGTIVGSDREPTADVRGDAGTIIVRLIVDDGRCENAGSATAELRFVRPPPNGVRCDANGDRRIDISDPIFTLSYLFAGKVKPLCEGSLDCNGDDALDIGDVVFALGFLFANGPGPDPWCDRFPGCAMNCP